MDRYTPSDRPGFYKSEAEPDANDIHKDVYNACRYGMGDRMLAYTYHHGLSEYYATQLCPGK